MSELLNLAADNPPSDNPAAETAGTPPAAPPDWRSGLPADLQSVAEAKGWKSPEDALQSYTHLEKLIPADKDGRGFLLPKDEGDAEAYDKIYKALGRPDSPDGYGLNEFLGGEVNSDVLSPLAAAMHEAGVSTRQAQHLAKAYTALEAQAAQAENERFEAELGEVKASMSPRRLELIKRGFQSMGLSPETAGELEWKMGPKLAAAVFEKLGGLQAEDSMPTTGQSSGGLIGSPQAAAAKIDQLLADPHFNQRYMNGDQSAIDQIGKLTEIAAKK